MRSTTPLAEDLAVADKPTATDAERVEGVLSLVMPDKTQKQRRLPSVYLDKAMIFADKDFDQVSKKLQEAAHAAIRSRRVPMYKIQACRIGDRVGLYARDMHNRSPFTRRLRRAGMDFSDDIFVQLEDDGTFESQDFGRFQPEFAILNVLDADDPDRVVAPSPAEFPFLLSLFRMGKSGPSDLRALVSATKRMEAMGARNPEAVIQRIESLKTG